MAWTSMHFAIGMMGGGVIAGTACLLLKRSTRLIGPAMTLGGIWAIVPDLPRLFREDFPSLPLASVLGSFDLERRLHAVGDLFFFHASLDAQPREWALHGLAIILLLYNAALLAPLLRRVAAALRVDPRIALRSGSYAHQRD